MNDKLKHFLAAAGGIIYDKWLKSGTPDYTLIWDE